MGFHLWEKLLMKALDERRRYGNQRWIDCPDHQDGIWKLETVKPVSSSGRERVCKPLAELDRPPGVRTLDPSAPPGCPQGLLPACPAHTAPPVAGSMSSRLQRAVL